MPDVAAASQFIGRAGELVRLDAALARAADGSGGVAIVAGEAGIGKTSLLEHFASSARGTGAHVLVGGCLEFAGPGVPFAPFVEIIRTLVTTTDPARLPALLGPGRWDLARLVAEIAGRSGERDAVQELDRNSQARLFEAVLGALERIARPAPVALVIEDLQWADEDTLDLLTFLLRHLRASRILVVLSIRTDDAGPRGSIARFVGEVERDEGVARIDLSPFDRRDLRALLAGHVTAPLPRDQFDSVLTRSGGNPFYAIQLLGMAPEGQSELPPQLRDVLRIRLATLSSLAQKVVRAASAAGPSFDDDLLAAAVGAPTEDVANAFRESIEAGVLAAAGPDAAGAGGYAFRHALLREVAYGQLLEGERVRLHARFADALLLRRQADPDVSAAKIAFHLDAAHDRRRAIPALIEAGAEAEGAFAFAAARQAYDRVLELWDDSEVDLEGTSEDLPAVLQRAAECALLTGAYETAIDLGRRAIASLEAIPPVDAHRLGILNERLRWYLWEAGDDVAADAAVTEALRLIPADPPSATRARALGQAAGLRMLAGDLPVAHAIASEATAMAVEVSAPAEEAFARGVLGWCEAISGDVDVGLSTFRDAIAIAERLGGAEGIALGHTNYAALLDRVGRTEQSLAAALEGVAVVRRLGVSRTYGGILVGHATKALFDLGRWDEARRIADEGLELDPVGLSAIWLHINHARLDTNQGRYAAALDHLGQARALGPAVGRSGTYGIALLAAEADLARSDGRLGDVRAAVDSAAGSIVPGRPLDPAFGWLAATGLRAEADTTIIEAARHNQPAVELSRERGAGIIDQSRALSKFAYLSADARREAVLALCRAEAARLMGEPDDLQSSAWEDVARRWEALHRPFPASYAWFRAAEAEIRGGGSRGIAGEQLARAQATTVKLGADPLRDDIELLARRAHLVLAGQPAVREGPAGSGLTARESEVVRLVAAGWSNQQIADALFITRKTASVHVSNIMAKLGVRNRVEIAVIAQQLGLAAGASRPGSEPSLDHPRRPAAS